jgi:hypothetical protein
MIPEEKLDSFLRDPTDRAPELHRGLAVATSCARRWRWSG